jgi:hypothetical protein
MCTDGLFVKLLRFWVVNTVLPTGYDIIAFEEFRAAGHL